MATPNRPATTPTPADAPLDRPLWDEDSLRSAAVELEPVAPVVLDVTVGVVVDSVSEDDLVESVSEDD